MFKAITFYFAFPDFIFSNVFLKCHLPKRRVTDWLVLDFDSFISSISEINEVENANMLIKLLINFIYIEWVPTFAINLSLRRFLYETVNFNNSNRIFMNNRNGILFLIA